MHEVRYIFKPVEEQDFPLLFTWFHKEHIASVWPEPKEWLAFEQKWRQQLSDRYGFIVYSDELPFGYIQYYHVNADDRKKFNCSIIPEPAVGLDLFIGEPEYLGKGHGTKILHHFIEFIKLQEPLCKALIIDPATDNVRAIACYEKVGFKRDNIYEVSYGRVDGPGLIILMMYRYT